MVYGTAVVVLFLLSARQRAQRWSALEEVDVRALIVPLQPSSQSHAVELPVS